MEFIDLSGYTNDELLVYWTEVDEQRREDYKLPNAMMATNDPTEVNKAQVLFRELQSKYGPLRAQLRREIESRGLSIP